MKKLDLTGEKYSLLTVRREEGRTYFGQVQWICDCECGATTLVTTENLRSGNTKSCGCLKASQRGHSRKVGTLYQTWRAMMRRCYETTSHAYHHYGGRGITVCDRWHDYSCFEEDMGGARPRADLTLDRINNDGIYEPSNCRWATKKEQAMNRRNPWASRKTKEQETV